MLDRQTAAVAFNLVSDMFNLVPSGTLACQYDFTCSCPVCHHAALFICADADCGAVVDMGGQAPDVAYCTRIWRAVDPVTHEVLMCPECGGRYLMPLVCQCQEPKDAGLEEPAGVQSKS